MIYLFYGDDTYSSRRALRDLYWSVGAEDVWDTGISHVDGAKFDHDHFASIAMVLPFLAERRLVVVHDLLTSSDGNPSSRSRRRGKKAEVQQSLNQLISTLTNLPESTDVVFIDARLTKTNPLLAQIQALGASSVRTKEFRTLRGQELANWVRDRVNESEGRITTAAVAALVDTVGGNLWAMSNEVEKLLLSDPKGMIEVEDVNSISSATKESTVFEVVDAIMEQKSSVALKGIQSLLENGTSAPYLIAMIARQARLVVLAQTLTQGRLPQSELADRLGIQQEFVLRKTLDQARKSKPDTLRELYRLILEADLSIKTGRVSEEIALTELAALVSSPPNRIP